MPRRPSPGNLRCLLAARAELEVKVAASEQIALPASVYKSEQGLLALHTRRRYQRVQQLLTQGTTICAIARELGLARRTVRRFARASSIHELLTARPVTAGGQEGRNEHHREPQTQHQASTVHAFLTGHNADRPAAGVHVCAGQAGHSSPYPWRGSMLVRLHRRRSTGMRDLERRCWRFRPYGTTCYRPQRCG